MSIPLCFFAKDNSLKVPATNRLAALLVLPLMLALVSFSGRGSRKPITIEHFFDNFKRVVATADKDGYTPYWLGREFTAGGFTFHGPYVSDLPGAKVEGGGVDMDYSADTPRGGDSLA